VVLEKIGAGRIMTSSRFPAPTLVPVNIKWKELDLKLAFHGNLPTLKLHKTN